MLKLNFQNVEATHTHTHTVYQLIRLRKRCFHGTGANALRLGDVATCAHSAWAMRSCRL